MSKMFLFIEAKTTLERPIPVDAMDQYPKYCTSPPSFLSSKYDVLNGVHPFLWAFSMMIFRLEKKAQCLVYRPGASYKNVNDWRLMVQRFGANVLFLEDKQSLSMRHSRRNFCTDLLARLQELPKGSRSLGF